MYAAVSAASGERNTLLRLFLLSSILGSLEEAGMFKVPAGAKVWALDATPVLELKDGSVVFAAKPDIPVPPETFAKAEPADDGDMAFWAKRYASP